MFSKNKKLFVYEIDPLFFYDDNKDGFGDFKGFLKKIDYFEFLNIDAVLFPDLFNQEDTILKSVNTYVFDKYGNIEDLKKIIEWFKEKNIELIIEIDINNIMNSMILKANMKNIKSKDINQLVEGESTLSKEEGLNWYTTKRKESFIKIVKFWSSLGIKNFVFRNIEDRYKTLSKELINKLTSLYQYLKENVENSNIGIRTFFLKNKTINILFNEHINKFFDYLIDSSYSLLATEKNHEFDLMKHFNHKMLIKKIKSIDIVKELKNRYFISFNNNKIGRVNSRWLNESNLINESNKSLLLLTNSLEYSSINYYGDELGTQRLKLLSKDDYYDYEYNDKKRNLETLKYEVEDFEKSQKFLSRINSQNTFIWNHKKNFGFSEVDNIFRKFPINSEKFNLKEQYFDKNSIVNFYKYIVSFFKEKSFNDSNIKVSLFRNVFVIKYDKNHKMIINLSNKTANYKISNKWNVSLSTINDKKYEGELKILLPFESLMIFKKQ